jgi:hypothetical protein
LHVSGGNIKQQLAAATNGGFNINNGTNDLIAIGTGGFAANGGSVTDGGIRAANSLVFATGSGAPERARLTSDGKFLVGTSSARANLFNSTVSAQFQVEGAQTTGRIISVISSSSLGGEPPFIVLGKQNSGAVGGNTAVAVSDGVGVISFQGNDGSEFVEAARIEAYVDGTPGANDMPGRLVFSTTADGASSPTERMRITSDGSVFIGNTGSLFLSTGAQIASNGSATFSRDSNYPLLINRQTTDGTIVDIRRGWSTVGTISVTTTATAYNTSSDYRLKENVTTVTDGIARLQQLKPSRFNFIADPTKTVDGFLAHEVQTIVPEAITGEKDAVDADGNPAYQGIDQSKLVPLLTAALQEAVAKIESLEARLTAAGI